MNIKPLPADLQKVAEEELNEVPSRVQSDLEALRTWIEQTPHLNARTDPQFLIQYLRGCKYSLEKSKEKIDLYFTLKSKFPELFNVTDFKEESYTKPFNTGFAVPLPVPLNENGPRIFFFNYEGDPGKGVYKIEDLFRVATPIHEILIMEDPYAGVNGIVYIIDLTDISLTIASQFTPSFMCKVVQFFERSMPLRIKSIHFINAPGFFITIINLLLTCISEKLKQRVFIYGHNYESICNHIPKKYLPKRLGGENGDVPELLKDLEKKFEVYGNYFKENEDYGTNELLRSGKPIDFDSIFGMGGSFRKLDVD